MKTPAMRKITVILPKDLIDRAMEATGAGLTPTIREALESVAARRAFARILTRKGKVRFDFDLAKLRED